MSTRPALPTYRDLFGALDFSPDEPGRSALSPAAYLADLLQQLEDRFVAPDFFARRGDIRELLLNAENSYVLLPYLEIVNGVLSAKVAASSGQADAQATLAAASYPLSLPFERQHARLGELLKLLQSSPQELHRLFTPTPDIDLLARAELGLSPAMAAQLTRDLSADPLALAQAYGLDSIDALPTLADLEIFQQATQIDAKTLRELLYLRLSQHALDAHGHSEREAASMLFVNAGADSMGGYVHIDDSQTWLVWSTQVEAPLPASWLDRAQRLLRLSRWTGVALVDLDLVLRTLCANVLDDAALRRLAVVRELARAGNMAIDEVCSLLAELDSLGAADEFNQDPSVAIEQGTSLFDRVFNAEPARLAEAYFPGWQPYVAEPYQGFAEVVVYGDLLLDENEAARLRIQRALGVSSLELERFVEALRERAAARGRSSRLLEPFGPSTLSLLHRSARLAELLDVSIVELLQLLDVIEADSSLRGLGALGVVEEDDSAALAGAEDLHQVLEYGGVAERSWMVRTLVAVQAWARVVGLSVADLVEICLPAPVIFDAEELSLSEDLEAIAATQARLSLCQSLVQAFEPKTFTAASLRSAQVDERSASAAWSLARQPRRGLVAAVDPGLIRATPEAARRWAFDATAALDMVTPDELAALGLGESLAPILHEALVRRGTLDLEGKVLELALRDLERDPTELGEARGADCEHGGGERGHAKRERGAAKYADPKHAYADPKHAYADPEHEYGDSKHAYPRGGRGHGEREGWREHEAAGPFVVEAALDRHAGAVFDRLTVLCREATAQGVTIKDADVHLYLSDLLGLDIPRDEAEAILANLRLPGVIDDQGRLSAAGTFLDPQQRRAFTLELGLRRATPTIRAFFRARYEAFSSAPLTIGAGDFESLGLSTSEREGLLRNLVFNGVLDERHRLIDKQAISALAPGELRLALPYHRHRRAVQGILQARVETARAKHLRLSADELVPLAAQISAQRAFHALRRASSLDEHGRPSAALREQLRAQREPAFGGVFDELAEIDEAGRVKLWTHLRAVVEVHDQFVLTDAAAASIDLGPSGAAALRTLLIDNGDLREEGGLVPARVPFFLELDNALAYDLEDSEDYARDVFVLLHDIALRTNARVSALLASLAEAAQTQREAVSSALAAGIELGSAETAVLLGHLQRDDAQPLESLIAPLLASRDADGVLREIPEHRRLARLLDRAKQFAAYARKLDLGVREIELAFAEQGLVDKFPELLELPAGIDGVDAILPDLDGELVLFRGDSLWTFAVDSLEPLVVAQPLSLLSSVLTGVSEVDAAYTDAAGDHWLYAAGKIWRRAHDDTRWLEVERRLGEVESRFVAPAAIDAAFTDYEGVSYMLVDDQYVRSSDGVHVDAGYPRSLDSHFDAELGFALPPALREGHLDAVVVDRERRTWLFANDRAYRSDLPHTSDPIDLRARWGLVRNEFADMRQVDGVAELDGRCCLFVDDQVLIHADSLETPNPRALDGYPKTIARWMPALPQEFTESIDAGFTDWSGRVHLFHERSFSSSGEGGWQAEPTRERWGQVLNHLQDTGRVDAAFVGLDGRLYLFCATQYLRYSDPSAEFADEGYPRTIAEDWGGIAEVDAAFVLDGRTYLFGTVAEGGSFYLRYSTRDYESADEGYPLPLDDNWWNLPFSLVEAGFGRPDAIMSDGEGEVWLFSGDDLIRFDHLHRWWSEPEPISARFEDLPFAKIGAAFTDGDGHTWLFSASPNEVDADYLMVRYSNGDFSRVDDRFPKRVRTRWGRVRNNIQDTGLVDAALRMISPELEEDEDEDEEHSKLLEAALEPTLVPVVYLFSGDQFYRYSSADLQWVDEGYPRELEALREEPRFAELDDRTMAALRERGGLDGVWADGNSVYLFIGDEVHVAATALSREFDELGERVELASLRAAAIDEGRLLARGAEGWIHLQMPEASGGLSPAAVPGFMRGAPEAFRSPEAALLGRDANVYLFANGQCWDRSLERSYPISEGWARVDCAIAEDERVDAALRDREGRLWLFRGGEYLTFTPPALNDEGSSMTLPVVADGPPRSIAARFGLRSVAVAYTVDEQTWLLEAPDAAGNFRYQCFEDEALREPMHDEAQRGDLSFWQLPGAYVEQGFDRVDAVLVDERDLFLIRGREFVHYEAATQTWTYPRKLELYWRGLPERHPDFEDIRAAFEDGEGTTWMFSDGACYPYRADEPAALVEIETRWGQIDNRVSLDQRVDASLVVEDYTYLFAGEQYVRYTGSSYDHVDPGYPKLLAGNLRREPGFANLSEDLEHHFEALEPGDRGLELAFANARSIYLVAGGAGYVCVRSQNARLELPALGQIRNALQRRARVDASFALGKVLWLISGDQAYRYSPDQAPREGEPEFVDDGFPISIPEQLLPTLLGQARDMPEQFQAEIDAAMVDREGALVLLREGEFMRVWPGQPDAPTQRGLISSLWQPSQNPFAATSDDEPAPRVDAALLGPAGELLVFKGDQVIRYADPGARWIDEGYPKSLHQLCGELPADFEAGIEGAFGYAGRRYLVCADRYVQLGGDALEHIDALGPQPFARRWRHANDYLIRDLHLVSRVVELDRRHGVVEVEGQFGRFEGSLLDLLCEAQDDVAEPYALLAGIFDWEVDALQWLVRRAGFLRRFDHGEDLLRSLELEYDLELILRLIDVMDLCARFGASPREIHEQVWQRLHGQSPAPSLAADALRRMLGTLYTGADWQVIERQLIDADNRARRDALVAWLIAHEPGFADARDIYEALLIDVEVEPELDTSRVVEAISAVQLYIHRYLVNLESLTPVADPAVPAAVADRTTKSIVKQQWEWMQNYRVWEANRRVFLHPENYIRPELREDRTPAFQALQDDLLQGEINDLNATKVFKTYLDEYTEVSRLAIAGGYIREDSAASADRQLFLFGHTRTKPRRYYYRSASFIGGQTQSVSWQAWEPLGIEIDADRVYPVDAFGRLFVFWVQLEVEAASTNSTAIQRQTVNGVEQVSGTNNQRTRLQVYFSYYDLNLRWVPAQPLDIQATETAAIQGMELVVERAGQLGAEDQENIIVGLSYSVNDQVRRVNASLTADLVTHPATRPPTDLAGIELFDSLFAASERPQQIVRLSTAADSSEGPWYSFDLKGGSFLCKPAVGSLDQSLVALRPLTGNTHGLPEWDRVDAGFAASDGATYLFHNPDGLYAKVDSTGGTTVEALRLRWGHIDNPILNTGEIDAAWWMQGKLFLSRGGQYLRYSQDTLLADAEGMLELSANIDGLPQWSRIDAAFTDAAGRVWFFGDGQCVRSDNLGSPVEIRTRWGQTQSEFATSAGDQDAVIAAFVVGEHTYVVSSTQYLRYTGSDYAACDAGYPKAQSLMTLLDELGCKNPGIAETDEAVSAVVQELDRLVFTTVGERDFGLSGDKLTQLNVGRARAASKTFSKAQAGVVDGERELAFGRGGADTVTETDMVAALALAPSAAMLGLDGKLYIFSGSAFITLEGVPALTEIRDAVEAWDANRVEISTRWGTTTSALTETNHVDAALRLGDHTFLFSGEEYLRYTGDAYEVCDAGYPKRLADNDDGLPRWATLTAAVEAISDDEAGAPRTCLFSGTEHAFLDAPDTRIANTLRWGLIDNQLLSRGVDAAWVEGQEHLLICGQQLIRYTADASGQLGRFMDAGYPKSLALARFGRVRAAFVVGDDFYVVGDGVFVCCPVSSPERIRPAYPKKGYVGALLNDVNQRHGSGVSLPAYGYEHLAVRAASVSGGRLTVDLDDGDNFYGVTLRAHLSLPAGGLDIEWVHLPWVRIWGWSSGWKFLQPQVQTEENTEVDVVVGAWRYRFRDAEFMRTPASQAVDANTWTPDARSVDSIWGAAAIDAAVQLDGQVYLFIGDHYVRTPGPGELGDLSLARAIDGAWGNLPATLRQGVDAALYAGGALTLFRGDQYLRFPVGGPEPYELSRVKYDIVRLTTATAATLNQRLFAGGLPGLLDLRTQEVDELPRFSATNSSTTTIRFNPTRVGLYPIDSHLDFHSANGIYYWEVFFHAPFLIASSLNTSQRFDEARRWYEYVFDPTEAPDLWKFLPFLGADVEALATAIGDRLTRLGEAGVDLSQVEPELRAIAAAILAMDAAFQGERALSPAEHETLSGYTKLTSLRARINALSTSDQEAATLVRDLDELAGLVERLAPTWTAMQSSASQLQVFLDDPFEPHAIAGLRRIAYRKALLMRYIDNLLDWGDMLFSQYSRESINEARMLYVLAWDLLGRRPTPLGRRVLADDSSYGGLRDASVAYDFLLFPQAGIDPADSQLSFAAKLPTSVTWASYFYLPENDELVSYWARVEDRLYKIRHGLNLLGVKQPLPLFQPPLDPMAIVAAVAGGASLSAAVAGARGVDIPHYRFSFLIAKAQQLTSKLQQFGGDLLAALEKRDSETLSRLQSKQEQEILSLTVDVRRSQIDEALAGERGLQESRKAAVERQGTYSSWIDKGLNGYEIAQLTLMSSSVAAHVVSTIARIVAAIGGAVPDVTVGPFSTGVQGGGDQANRTASSVAEISQGVAEGLSIAGEILGIVAQHERMKDEWGLQKALATYDIAQIDEQLVGAQAQIAAARQELAIVERQIEHSEAVAAFYREKFSNRELYQWMVDRLSTLYYQTYQLALDYARAAERAYQFETGAPERDVDFVHGQHWNSQRKGLLAGEGLGLELDRMEAAYLRGDARRLEICRQVSLLELDPLALLQLQAKGSCEFELGEALFAYDFPGHYRRQIKTLAVSFGEGVAINATLTQLGNRTVLQPDPKAVGFLLSGKGEAPISLRSNWKGQQQIVLSHRDQYDKNNGMFELRYDSERYLPFEGTGAVSRWRLELGAKLDAGERSALRDVTIDLRYTALQGGDAYAAAVRGQLEPYQAMRHIDVGASFSERWQSFLVSTSDTLVLPLTQALFPNISGSRISSLLAHYELANTGTSAVSMSLELGESVALPEGRLVETNGLRVGVGGTALTLKVRGDKQRLENLVLVMSYRAAVR
ncbi:hypothetical protein G6O69_36190 [Pseudenhygromyxa sp. WMMC2535]|uniref:Tc toxin subunit A-related protein n=1 Tax=Pseudenhygromyxa sp. WMMC2535 TaxID=2712867 RepID=UPI0015567C66|nr:hemopexin repeat-containing protein [Pseudenhygromyxa sp. WMMC2535]NVB43322.1 hypothetical protein [Pseudenhygromyxa sp. WMMC2535]